MIVLLLLGCAGAPATDPGPSSDDTDAVDSAGDTAPADGGWSAYGLETASSLRGVYSSGQGVYVVATRGQAWVGSATQPWTAVELPAELQGVDVNALWGNGAVETLELAVAADDGRLGVYTGGVWAVYTTGTGDNLGIDGTSSSDLYIVGEDGAFRFDGQGVLFEASSEVPLNAVYAWTGGAMACGDEGAVLLRGSSSWSALPTGVTAGLHAIGGSAASDIWVVGDRGTILRWQGSAWTVTDSPVTDTLHAVYVAPTGEAFAVGDGGVAVQWRGAGWKEVATGVAENLYAVHGVSGTNAWAVGDDGLAIQFKE